MYQVLNLLIMNKKDIAIIGGTFDPVHVGHIDMVKYLVDNYIVDEVWLLPSYNSPHKDINTKDTFIDRVNMLKIATNNIKNVLVNEFEEEYSKNNNNLKTYTYEVLEALKRKYLNCRFHFVVGFDSIKNITTWHRYDELLKNYWFYIFDREDNEFRTFDQKKYYLDNLGKNMKIQCIYEIFDTKITDISSTEIRCWLTDIDNNIDNLNKYLDKGVLDYILKNKLYGT